MNERDLCRRSESDEKVWSHREVCWSMEKPPFLKVRGMSDGFMGCICWEWVFLLLN